MKLPQHLGEETAPPPNEENPGAVLCVDTNGTAPRVPLDVYFNPGLLNNGELRLEGPPASQVRLWNHFTATNAANIVPLPFVTNLASNLGITTNFYVQAMEPSATHTRFIAKSGPGRAALQEFGMRLENT